MRGLNREGAGGAGPVEKMEEMELSEESFPDDNEEVPPPEHRGPSIPPGRQTPSSDRSPACIVQAAPKP